MNLSPRIFCLSPGPQPWRTALIDIGSYSLYTPFPFLRELKSCAGLSPLIYIDSPSFFCPLSKCLPPDDPSRKRAGSQPAQTRARRTWFSAETRPDQSSPGASLNQHLWFSSRRGGPQTPQPQLQLADRNISAKNRLATSTSWGEKIPGSFFFLLLKTGLILM